MIQPTPVTAAEILEEENLAEDDKSEEEDVGGGDAAGREGLSIGNIKELIDLGVRMRHILEQDVTVNSEVRCSFVMKALEGYSDQYHAHINSLQQRQITDFIRRRNETQPDPQPGPSSEFQLDSDDGGEDFEGFVGPFQTPTDADEFLDEIEHRRGGQ